MVNEAFNIVSNYIYSYREDAQIVKAKQHEGFIARNYNLYLRGEKAVDFEKNTINVTKRDPMNKENVSTTSLTHPKVKSTIEVSLISNNVFLLNICSL